MPLARRALNSSLIAFCHFGIFIACDAQDGSIDGGRGNLLTTCSFLDGETRKVSRKILLEVQLMWRLQDHLFAAS